MFKRLAGASAVAVLLAVPPVAQAADLSGDPYDDPRYAEIYRDAPPPPPPPAEPYEERYEERYERRDYVDRDGGSHRYDPPYARDYAGHGGCVPHRVIRRRLIAEGWHDFEDLEFRGGFALVEARRPSGRRFDLKIDRCTGEIVRARPLDGPGRYAYGPRRHWRY